MRNWLRNDYAEQVDLINYSDKQVDAILNDSGKQVSAISDYKQMVVTGSDAKSDPSSNQEVVTDTINRNFAQKLLTSWFIPKIILVVIQPIKPPITANVMGVQVILSPLQKVILKASATDATRSCARMNFESNSVLGKSTKFVDLGISPAHIADTLNSNFAPDTIAGGLTDTSYWIASRHCNCRSYGRKSEQGKSIQRLY